MAATNLTAERHSVLVVDDSSVLRSILKEELEAEGFIVHLAENGERGLELARDQRPDVILLDLMLSGLDGHDVCRALKADDALSHIPVLILSSRNELKDKLAGFESGADDYLTKPFFTKELVVGCAPTCGSRTPSTAAGDSVSSTSSCCSASAPRSPPRSRSTTISRSSCDRR
jgi:DNA-binding response OmpR family regulator